MSKTPEITIRVRTFSNVANTIETLKLLLEALGAARSRATFEIVEIKVDPKGHR